MSDKKSILDKIKALFADDTIPAPVWVDYVLSDGTQVQIDKLEVGGKVMVGGVAIAAGDYSLTDVATFTVDDTGTITVYTPVVAVDPAVPAIPDFTKMSEEERTNYKFAGGTPEERLTALETVAKALMLSNFGWQIEEANRKALTDQAIAIYKTGFSKATTEAAAEMADLKAQIAKLQKINAEMFALVEKLAEEPSDNPPGQQKVLSSFSKVQEKEARIQKMAEALKKMRAAKSNS